MFHARIDSDFITVAGADRLDFVHGLVTADVKGLADGSGTGSLLLNHRGHALAQLTVLRLPGLLLLAVEDGLADFVFAELDRHIIFDQVELSRTDSGFSQLTVQADAGQLQPALEQLSGDADWLGSAPARRSLSGGADVFFHAGAADADALLGQLGSRALGPDELERERVAAAVPRAALDAGEGVLPQEAGLEHLISYRKGCYLGQEIMARIEARGSLRRGLQQVQLAAEPGSERDIMLDGRRVGRLGTVLRDEAAGWSGLAVLRLDLPADAELQVGNVSLKVS